MTLLSISILSYNRINLLIDSLEKLIKGIDYHKISNEICIEIYDNCSKKDLVNKLEEFIFRSNLKKNLIKLYKNSSNKGYAKNLARAISNSKSLYTWTFSDDDFINIEALPKIISKLRENQIDFLSLKTDYLFKDQKLKFNSEMFQILDLYKPDINQLLSKEFPLDIDKNFGFISSNIVRTKILKKSLSLLIELNPKLKNNNYLAKVLNYISHTLTEYFAILINSPVVIQNLTYVSYYYDDPNLRKETFIYNLISIYKFLKLNDHFSLNKSSLNNLTTKYFAQPQLWIDLKRDNILKFDDIKYLYKNTSKIIFTPLLIFFIPLEIIYFLKKIKSFIFKKILKNS